LLENVFNGSNGSIFSEIFPQNTSIFARKPKKGEKSQIFAKFSRRIHQIFARKPKKEKIR